MKKSLLICLIALSMGARAQGQYHVRVVCNPDNGGHVSPEWVNNYIINYTWDNWKHSAPICAQQTYEGTDDNGIKYYTSYYQKVVYRDANDAAVIAGYFAILKAVNYFQAKEKKKHQNLSRRFDAATKKLCFGCKPAKHIKCCKAINIY